VDFNEKKRLYVRPAERFDHGSPNGIFAFDPKNTQHKHPDFFGSNIDVLCTYVCRDIRKGGGKKQRLCIYESSAHQGPHYRAL
jgi:hypothetical protein